MLLNFTDLIVRLFRLLLFNFLKVLVLFKLRNLFRIVRGFQMSSKWHDLTPFSLFLLQWDSAIVILMLFLFLYFMVLLLFMMINWLMILLWLFMMLVVFMALFDLVLNFDLFIMLFLHLHFHSLILLFLRL